MAGFADYFPEFDVLTKIEPEDVGGLILQAMNAGHNHVTRTHVVNGLCGGQNPRYSNAQRPTVFQIVCEAWSWLEAQGLIVWADEANGPNGFRVTSRRGQRLIDPASFVQYRRGSTLPREFLHPRIAEHVWLSFLRGEFDAAVLLAFKAVEIAVRDASKLPQEDIGPTLMRKAFDAKGGPLTDPEAHQAEREALAHLFAGAMGYYKNPQSHRKVGISAADDAREMIVLASHLLRIVDARTGK